MSSQLINQNRLEQTRREFSYLRDDVAEWLRHRRSKDSRKQHHSQLNILEGVLLGAMDQIAPALDQVALDKPRSDLYSTCRLLEQRIVWIRRIWDYFREKFDQRDDASLGPLLGAADEIVWSCYSEVFHRATGHDKRIKRGPAPLPYVDLIYSPHAIPRAEPPPGLKSDIDAPFLREFLQQLPISVVALPVNCTHDPWWLASLAHEVGHHVQYELLPDWELVGLFGEHLRAAVVSANGSGADELVINRWVSWGREIFADLFSILCLGPWALWIINEFELGSATMHRNRVLYPSGITRLALMEEMLGSRGLGVGPNILERFVGGLSQRDVTVPILPAAQVNQSPAKPEDPHEHDVFVDLRIAPHMATAISGFMVGNAGLLKDLCNWDATEFETYQRVYNFAVQLLQPKPPNPWRQLRGARLFASASVAAWASVSTEPDEALRQAKRDALARNVLVAVRESGPDGTRAAEASVSESQARKLGDDLGSLLLRADVQDLNVRSAGE